MDLASINVATKNAFAAAFASEGVLAIGRVNLLRTFQPDTTDVIFLQVRGGCEVYVDSRILYTGTDLRWREIMSQPDAPGNARFVVAGIDFFAALRLVTELLAGESTQGQDAPENDQRFTWLQTLGLSGSPTAEQVKKTFRRL